MKEINFFSYPEIFNSRPKADIIGVQTPFNTYYFKVQSEGTTKELYWEDEYVTDKNDAKNLRELARLIMNMVYSSQEYKNLPPARGGYD